MRALSPHLAYSVKILDPVERMVTDPNGSTFLQIIKPPVIANFQHAGLFPEEVTIALQTFSFSNLPEGVNPASRVAVYDTDIEAALHDWDDEFHALVKERLRAKAVMSPGDLAIVEDDVAPLPWPTYDSDDVEEIILIAQRLNLVEVVRAYEKDNAARTAILEGLDQEAAKGGEELGLEVTV